MEVEIPVVVKGKTYHTFLLDYDYDGRTYSVNIMATDWEDALCRAFAIRESARIEGQIDSTIPAES